MAYGYDPDQHRRPSQRAGCRDVLVLTRVAFAVLLPPLLAIVIALMLLIAAFALLTVHPALSLLPLLPLVLAVVWLVRRDRRAQEEAERDALGDGPAP